MGGPSRLPAAGGWQAFADAAGYAGDATFGDDEIDRQVGAEASSSESEDDADATVVYVECRAASG